jgi:hypothetical protein
MAGPLASVAPWNTGREGGAFISSSTPTGAGGAGYPAPGARSFPAPSNAGIMHARQNSGSNVRIPYARVVPKRPPTKIVMKGDKKGEGTAVERDESEGLGSGEVGWIMGRRYKDTRFSGLTTPISGEDIDGAMHSGVPKPVMESINNSAHALGSGYGVDRMQRLASTDWIESFFELGHADNSVSLEVAIGSTLHKHLSGAIATVAGKTGPGDADRAVLDGSIASRLELDAVGPFLAGKSAVSGDDADARYDELAFEALYASMRMKALFDWSPDGMVLSKLESPAGDSLSSSALDLRDAQLFNVAVQGPAIAKTWTGDSLLACMPMDKVMVVMTAKVGKNKDGETALKEFKLKRVTTSYLIAYSYPGDDAAKRPNPRLRCGLADDEYIIGGWSIGTVLDNSASRAQIGSQVRTAPASLALNINVNVEWWSGDKLFRHFNNDGSIRRRDQMGGEPPSKKRRSSKDVDGKDESGGDGGGGAKEVAEEGASAGGGVRRDVVVRGASRMRTR